MKINHLEPGYTDKAAPFIREFGGKMGGLEFLRCYVPELRKYLLETLHILPDKRIDTSQSLPASASGRVAVRASDPRDFQGLVDALHTELNVPAEWGDVIKAIVKIRLKAREALAYGKYENPEFDGNVIIGIQPFVHHANGRGSIVDHPNIEKTYVGSFVQGLDITTGLYNGSGKRIVDYTPHGAPEDAAELAYIHRIIAASELVRDHLSFQVEFVRDAHGIHVVQVRAFQPKEYASFSMRYGLAWPEPLSFGVTPSESEGGLVLPVVYVNGNGFDGFVEPDEPWALLKVHNERRPPPLAFRPERMAAYLVGQKNSGTIPSLEHKHFRLAQKAGVTLFEHGGHHDFEDFRDPGAKIRLFCNGKNSYSERA